MTKIDLILKRAKVVGGNYLTDSKWFADEITQLKLQLAGAITDRDNAQRSEERHIEQKREAERELKELKNCHVGD